MKKTDGVTWFARMTKPKEKEEPKKEELLVPTTDPVNKPRPKVEKPKADPIPAAPFKKGASVMAAQDMALFTQPSAETRFTKAKAARFDILGTFDSTASSAYPGWSKIYVTKTLKTGTKVNSDVPNKWMAYVKTNMLTQPV